VTAVVVAVSALLAAVAAAGVLAPLRRQGIRGPEAPPDPLEEERDAFLRALRDLDDDRATGRIDAGSHLTQRREVEAQAVAVLRALEARDGEGRVAEEIGDIRRPRPVSEQHGGRILPALLTVLVVTAVLIPALVGAVGDRAPGQVMTGGLPLSQLEDRVRRHPADPAARLDLAEAYLARGDVDAAIDQYVAVLDDDPRNPEAHARLGALLFRADRPREALDAVNRALEIDPSYPEALYLRGLILARGLGRPGPARAALEEYLDAAPFGAHVEEARDLLDGI
jgi:tetratricopeptide (TPR) repeat protein